MHVLKKSMMPMAHHPLPWFHTPTYSNGSTYSSDRGATLGLGVLAKKRRPREKGTEKLIPMVPKVSPLGSILLEPLASVRHAIT